jgi:hypothetical protein
MARTRSVLGGLLLVSACAACTATPQAGGGAHSAAARPPAPAATTTTPPPPPGLGAVHKTTVLALTGTFTGPGSAATPATGTAVLSGSARVTVTWHDEKAMSLDDLLPGCRAQVLSAEPGDGTVLSAVAAEVRAGFPAGTTSTLTFGYGDGPQAASPNRAYACAGATADPDATAQFSLTPQAPAATVMWVRFGSGKITADDPSGYTITETDQTGACGTTCTTSYG